MMTNPNHSHPSVLAREIAIVFRTPLQASELKSTIEEFLIELIVALKHMGCTLIGHVKGLVDAKEQGHLIFSVTSFGEAARFKGDIHTTISEASLTINIIVYGVDAAIIDSLFRELSQRYFSLH